jgi:uncharacterized membrane protein YwaF
MHMYSQAGVILSVAPLHQAHHTQLLLSSVSCMLYLKRVMHAVVLCRFWDVGKYGSSAAVPCAPLRNMRSLKELCFTFQHISVFQLQPLQVTTVVETCSVRANKQRSVHAAACKSATVKVLLACEQCEAYVEPACSRFCTLVDRHSFSA